MINRPVGLTVGLTSLSLEREGLRFKPRASHIGHSVDNSSPPLQHFLKRSCVAWAQELGDAEMGPTKSSGRHMLWSGITASTVK